MSESPNILLVNRAIISNDDDQLLIVQRSYEDSRNGGQWEFPGGKVDAGETIHDGLAREVLEETGLIIRLVSVIHYEDQIIPIGKYKNRLYISLFHTARLLEGTLVLSVEHEAAAWIEPKSIDYQLMTNESCRALKSFVRLAEK